MLALLGLLKNPWVLLIIACALGVIGTGWYRMEYESEKAGRVADALAAQQAADAKVNQAKTASDTALADLQTKLALQSTQSITYVDRIVHDAPSACPPSPAARDAARGVRDLLSGATGPAPAK
jgi:uncharacterized membrane protein